MCNKSYLKNFAVESTTLIPLLEKITEKPKNCQVQYFIFLQNGRLDIFFLLRYSNNRKDICEDLTSIHGGK